LDDNSFVAGGLGIPYEQYSQDLGGYYEIISRGAFTPFAQKRSDPVVFASHNQGQPMGRFSRGTLRLIEKDNGIHYEFDIPDTTWGRDLVISLRRGDIEGSSFGFIIDDFSDKNDLPIDWSEERNGLPVRRIKRFKEIFDFSPVAIPAYKMTTAALRELRALTEVLNPYIPIREIDDFIKLNKFKHA